MDVTQEIPVVTRYRARCDRLATRGWRLLLTGAAVMAAAGMGMAALVGVQLYGGGSAVQAHTATADQELEQQWAADPPPSAGPKVLDVPDGWRLWIPRLGLHWVVAPTAELADIKWAPGHYVQTAKPGGLGNFSMAGHREPGIFADLDRMRPGDPIVVESRTKWMIYRVSSTKIIPDTPAGLAEIAPIPPGFRHEQRLLTLTTCNPKWDNYERLIVHAVLDHTIPHAQGPPLELEP